MKRLFTFKLTNDELVDESKTVEVDGKTVTTTEKVKKSVDHTFFIRKPNRSLSDDARLFYGIKYTEAVKAGMLPAAVLPKTIKDEKLSLNKEDIEIYNKLLLDLNSKREEFDKLSIINEETKTEDQKKRYDTLLGEIVQINRTLSEYEANQTNLQNQTADAIAREATMRFWLFNLAYDEKEKCLFGDGNYNQKLEKLDEIIDKNDEFLNRVINYFTILIGFWFASSQRTEVKESDIDNIFKILVKEEELQNQKNGESAEGKA